MKLFKINQIAREVRVKLNISNNHDSRTYYLYLDKPVMV